ncbi:PREDICTED: wall-associated receptor kinase-like 9 isoform X1 [Brassica oleracea var. oleracea]|uniref:wall-associated receptor kinase-like 9 isoform X1 n=1 Tax=Brassica oleracea var. oleracea TaxID=109376 RepID=UPI0006A6A96A|nr:PREDICTED: wall-associated receptor kinase-like 9 isoform X1 [Brassica oleracea var. oleracea]
MSRYFLVKHGDHHVSIAPDDFVRSGCNSSRWTRDWTSQTFFYAHINGANLTASRSSCPSHCGSISIPYPFGIGSDCYLNEWFAIQCNNSTSGDLVPYLPKINKEVVKISLPDPNNFDDAKSYGSLRIKTNITSMGCSNSSDETKFDEPLNITGSPFTISRSNIFQAIGCNYKATLTHLDPTVVGCISTCEPRKIGDHTSCRGNKCCQVDPPSEIGQIVGISMEEISSNVTRKRGCRVAFLTDENQDPLAYREGKVTDPNWFYDRQYVRLQLRWAIQMKNLSFINSLGCTMGHSSSSVSPCICVNNTNDQISSVGCACHKGYIGNPYIMGGCKDIDECQLDKGNYENCRPQGGTCVNTPGSYQCVFKKYKTMPVTMGLCVGFGVLMMVFAVAFLLCKFIKKQRKIICKNKLFRRNGGLLLKQQLTSTEGSIEKTKVFTSKELKKATENFSSTRVLGKGGQGTVYKGMLVDGRIVAVKKSTVVDQDKVGEFINEVVILSQINHRNIVKLIGCCLETEVPLLVYEFVSNGNIFEHLHGEFDESAMTSWEMRLRIVIDIAGALSYLHSSASTPIFHRDVKSTNIMLDEKYRVKVSDFGTSRWVTDDHTHLTTVVSGTVGYVDPEYFQTSQFTDKSDVYSFGVVLVELITGEKPISLVRFLRNRTLAAYFILAMEENRLIDIIDPQIRAECKLEQVMAAAQLARRCLMLTGKDRPSMREVAMELERIRSSTKDLQSNVHIVINNAEEADIGVESCSVDTTSTLDAEPLFPGQTW